MSSARDLLTEYQQQILGSFQEISNIQDDQLAIEILQQNGWHLENALNAFMLGGNTTSSYPSPPPSSSNRRSTAAAGEPSFPPSAPPRQFSNRSSSNRVLSTDPVSNPPPNPPGDNSSVTGPPSSSVAGGSGILDLLLLPFRWLIQSRPLTINPQRDAEAFLNDFQSHYGYTHIPFHMGSYQSAVNLAFTESKFLLIYLHSPLHEDSDNFCSSILCNPQFIDYVNSPDNSVIVWGGTVWDPEAYGLSTQLNVSTFPFLGLLIPQSARSVQVADRIQGILDLETLLTRLRNVSSVYLAVIQQTRLETQRRAEAARLREQQDREYQESIEAERREIERQRKEEEEKIRIEEERKQQEELAAAVELSKKLSHEDEIRKIRTRFTAIPEPPAGPDVATIRFQLPRGKKPTFRFHKTDTAQRIHDYLKLQFVDEGDLTKNFTMSTTFPKMDVTDKLDQTIEALGLHPRGMLYVQDLDA